MSEPIAESVRPSRADELPSRLRYHADRLWDLRLRGRVEGLMREAAAEIERLKAQIDGSVAGDE